MHDEIPTRDGHWPHDIEGSYAPMAELGSVDHLDRKWLFYDHGHRTLVWDDHCNRGYTRPPSMSDLLDSLIARAEGWQHRTPTRSPGQAPPPALISARDEAELADRFNGTLEFGTAGLRGALGAGSNRMNRVVVTRTAAGLAAYLKDNGHRPAHPW